MTQFRTYFYRKSPLMKFSAAIYAVIFVVMLAFLFVNFEVLLSHIKLLVAYGFFIVCAMFMLLRALVIIFETIELDYNKREIRYRLLRKTISFNDIALLKMVRAGQLRVILMRGQVCPISVDDEEEFVRLMKVYIPGVKVE